MIGQASGLCWPALEIGIFFSVYFVYSIYFPMPGARMHVSKHRKERWIASFTHMISNFYTIGLYIVDCY
jgi:hypothetical protein